MKAFVYILKCSDNSFYVGSTENLSQRVTEHQSGNGAVHTMKRLPVELVYYERCKDKAAASAREKEIKGWSREKKEILINSAGWPKAFSIGVYAIIENNDQAILLMRHADKDIWMLPGGGVESNEPLTSALKREVREETEITISEPKLIIIHERTKKNQIIFVYHTRLANEPSNKFSPNLEAAEIQFFPLEHLPENVSESSLKRIKAYKSAKSLPLILTD